MWIVCGKDDRIYGYAVGTIKEKNLIFKENSFEEQKIVYKPVRSDCPEDNLPTRMSDKGIGWFSRATDIFGMVDLTSELHSKFLYLTYDNDPLWIDFFDPSCEKIEVL